MTVLAGVFACVNTVRQGPGSVGAAVEAERVVARLVEVGGRVRAARSADVESVRSGVLLVSPSRRDDAMGRVATCAFVRKESVPVERCAGPALVVECGSILVDAATVRTPELSNRPHW